MATGQFSIQSKLVLLYKDLSLEDIFYSLEFLATLMESTNLKLAQEGNYSVKII